MPDRERTTRYIILGLLTEQPLSGYDIKRYTELRFGFFWGESFGQIYPELGRLESEGLVVSKADSGSGRRGRKVFSITEAGRVAVRDWLVSGAGADRELVRYELLIRTYFGHLAPPDELIRRINSFRARHAAHLELLRLFERELRPTVTQDPSHLYVLMVIGFGLKTYEAYVAWCDEVLSVLQAQSRGAGTRDGGTQHGPQ